MSRKKTGLLVMAAAVLCLTMSIFTFPSQAATAGWVSENGEWHYYDKYGDMVKSDWVTDSSGATYYLDRSGNITTDSWVDDKYVGSDGIMLVSQWKKLRPTSGDSFDDYANEYWYYFGTKGLRVTSNWQTINGSRYYFDDQGKMQTGWLNDEYYFGSADDGTMRTGWVKALTYYDAENGAEDTDANRVWLYFQTNGKLYDPQVSEESLAVSRKIDGRTYAFGQYGAMKHGWVNLSDYENSKNISDYKYFGAANDGAMKANSWQYIVGPDYVNQESLDDGYNWYYLASNGTPRSVDKSGGFTRSDLVTISGKQYLFDEYGRTRHGLVWIAEELYYLGTEDECVIKTGKYTLQDDAGRQGSYYFTESSSSKGKGLTGIYDGRLYYKGMLQTAGEGQIYKAITLTTAGSYKNYLVNTSGTLIKSTTVTDGYGIKYKTNASGIITAINGDSVSTSSEMLGDDPVEAFIDK